MLVRALLLCVCAAGCKSKPDAAQPQGPPPQVTRSEEATVVDLGDVDPGAELAIEIPAGSLGFVIVATSPDDVQVGIDTLTSPSGLPAVAAFKPGASSVELALGTRGIGAISMPSTTATTSAPLESGTWTARFGGYLPAPDLGAPKGSTLPHGAALTTKIHVQLITQQTSDGAFHGGQLDMHVYVPEGLKVQEPGPVHAVNATSAAGDSALASRIDAFYSELQRLFGIGRGTVVFHPIDAQWLAATTGPARAALIAQATAAAPRALHVVLTNALSTDSGGSILGYSVGLPGAANIPGTVRSAISVALYDDGTVENDAITFVHELGHFAGLMHSTDYDGTPDLFDDTPPCGDGKLCADSDNLMAPDGPADEAVVSPSQIRAVRGSPLYWAATR